MQTWGLGMEALWVWATAPSPQDGRLRYRHFTTLLWAVESTRSEILGHKAGQGWDGCVVTGLSQRGC